MRDTPCEILKPIPHVVRVKYIDQVGMWTVDDKVKAEGLEEDLLCGEDLGRDLFNFLGDKTLGRRA